MFGLLRKRVGIIAVALAPLALAACGSSPTAYERARADYYDSKGEYLEDAALTSKVAAAILDEPRLRDSTIRVTTYGNIVQLTGQVESLRDAYIAEDLAASVMGVRRVDNDLVVN
ncbi:MAG: BON domain-containing protein [Rhodospirillaceae bacterium]